TKSGLGLGSAKPEAYVGISKFSTVEAGASVGGGSQTFGYFGSVNASKSDRFVDPVNFDNLHNHGDTARGFLRLDSASPVTAISDRTLNNYGVNPSFSWTNANNEVKFGGTVKRYPIRERFSFGITDPALNDPASADFNPNLAPYDLTRGGTTFVFNERRT